MHELLTCNYCKLQGIKKHNNNVETRAAHGGIDVFINGSWYCWFSTLTDGCSC